MVIIIFRSLLSLSLSRFTSPLPINQQALGAAKAYSLPTLIRNRAHLQTDDVQAQVPATLCWCACMAARREDAREREREDGEMDDGKGEEE